MLSLGEYIYTHLFESEKRYQFITGAGLLVAIFLNVFQPFGINTGGFSFSGIAMVSGYGLMTTLGLMMVIKSKLIFQRLYHFHPIIFSLATILLISLFIFSYFKIIFSGSSPSDRFVIIYLNTLIMSVIILLLIKGLFGNINLQKKGISDTIIIPSKNKSQAGIQLSINHLIMIEACGNYILVYYLHDNVLKKKLIRNTLRHVEEISKTHLTLVRCHSSFLINTLYLLEIKKNLRKHSLLMDYVAQSIPISKRHLENVKIYLSPPDPR